VVPPNPVPSPDNITATDDPFDFTRLGVRVPAVLVSPWVGKGAIEHARSEGSGQYEHSSLAATTVHKLFAPAAGHPQPAYLNDRDAWAATFESLFLQQAAPRDDADCPTTLPEPHYNSEPYVYRPRPLSDLQQEMLMVVAGATDDKTFSMEKIAQWTDAEAIAYTNKRFEGFFPLKA
jgi:phospholipase C